MASKLCFREVLKLPVCSELEQVVVSTNENNNTNKWSLLHTRESLCDNYHHICTYKCCCHVLVCKMLKGGMLI